MYSIGQFSKKTGVTIRSLRYYDEKGLLAPAYISEGGQRFYNDESIITIQKIVTFKYLNYSLTDIKALVDEDVTLIDSLKQQKEQLVQKQKQLNQMVSTLDTVITIHEKSNRIDESSLLLIIHSLLTEDVQKEYLKQFIPEPLIDKLYTFADKNMIEIQRNYLEVVYEIKEAYQNNVNDEQLKILFEKLYAIFPEALLLELSAELEKYPEIELDKWLFPSPLTTEEDLWLTEQIERLKMMGDLL